MERILAIASLNNIFCVYHHYVSKIIEIESKYMIDGLRWTVIYLRHTVNPFINLQKALN